MTHASGRAGHRRSASPRWSSRARFSMVTTRLPRDFVEFLRLLNEHRAEYLVVGGYAVGHHGYVRATADLDVWIRGTSENAERVADALRGFGFDLPEVTADLFLSRDRIIRLGEPPVQLEIHTSLSGVDFDECWPEREVVEWHGVSTNLIGLEKLKLNKRASGRNRDQSDLDHLP
jgi:hypothetical protein